MKREKRNVAFAVSSRFNLNPDDNILIMASFLSHFSLVLNQFFLLIFPFYFHCYDVLIS